MKTPLFQVILSVAIGSMALVGCDDKSDAAPADKKSDAKAAAKSDKKSDAKSDKSADAKSDKAADAKPEDKAIVACDQREFVSEGDKKMAEHLGKPAKPKLTCIDHSKRKEGLLSKPSCAQGTALETPCPDEDVISTCTLETTGVVYKHYKGIEGNGPERMCKTLEGTFAKVE